MWRPLCFLAVLVWACAAQAETITVTPSGGGGGAPTTIANGTTFTGGTDKQVCYNDAGTLRCDNSGGATVLTFDKATGLLQPTRFNATGAGAAATPSLSVGNVTTGLYSVSTTGLGVSINGVSKLDYGVTTAGLWTMAGGLTMGLSAAINMGGGTNPLFWNASTQITAPANGNLMIQNFAGTAFGLLMLGGSTSSFPALQRSGAGLIARLADNSADATFQSGQLIASGIGTDATHTDATVCEDTTSHQFYFGSGAAGICLGTSSVRFKTDLAPLAAGLADILRVETVSYRYRPGYGDPSRKLYGFTAEQMASVMPELVGLDADGLPNSVDWAGMVPVLVRAVQQQQARIVTLEGKIR